MDQIHHLPNTDWKMRPEQEFVARHEAAIRGDRWVIDGNYSKLFPRRFERATGIILLDVSTIASLLRYLRRTLLPGSRVGALEGGQNRIKFSMLHHIAVVTPGNRKRYVNIYRQTKLPKVYLLSTQAIKACSRTWELATP